MESKTLGEFVESESLKDKSTITLNSFSCEGIQKVGFDLIQSHSDNYRFVWQIARDLEKLPDLRAQPMNHPQREAGSTGPHCRSQVSAFQ